ncbi:MULTISPECIES: tetratricopeptide repeat protein [Hyphobacterium]|uniref:Tetratricopeptide repeat protein n=1 Tax=Hyphobacterium vulgare TaxID=1736751 RepID=A0ABV6ZZ73_9PROT
MTGLLAELRRRNVFRVAAAYLVVGWLTLQIVSLIEAPLGLPDWTDTLVIVLIGIGFPIALLLAWAFEMTPEGMKLTVAVPAEDSIASQTARKLDFAIVAGLVVLVGVIVWQQLASPQAATAPELAARAEAGEGASVAVLPFADMSPDSDQAYFADGISEEILNVLVRIPGLQVAGRTSSFAYRGQDQDLREIGSALNVSHVLEGSVRRSGTRLRITAQLIRSEDGFHLWSETYDRELTDIFDIQDEIAGAVADELATSLGLDNGAVSVARTSDMAAYETFLHARQLYRDRGQDNLELAAAMLTETLARDPEYGPGWTVLAGVYLVMPYYRQGDSAPAPELRMRWNALTVETARRAITINPADAQAHAFLGSALAENWNWVEGLDMLDRAVALAPNDPDVLDTAAQILGKVGYGAEALALSERAVALDPQGAIFLNTLGNLLAIQGRFDESDAQFRASIDIDPSLRFPYANLMWSHARAGDIAGTQSALTTLLDRGHPAPADEDLIEPFIAAQTLAEIQALAAESRGFVRTLYSLLASDMEYFFSQVPVGTASGRPTNWASYNPFWQTFSGEVFADPRWKDWVRRGGLVDLWRARGFPPQCRPVGADDFRCE